MPYKLEKSGEKYFVVDDTGKRYSDKPLPKWRAKKQLAALYANDPKAKAATEKPMKGGFPASCFLVVEDPEKPTTWHLQARDKDGKPDHRLMGAAWAALHEGYRGNKYEGPGKQEALSKLKKLYEQEDMSLPSEKNFYVFKEANGSWRWVSISSSAFRDRDGELITQKALAEDVDRCDAAGTYGPLRWFHLGGWEAPDGLDKWETWKAGPGIDLGVCDFNMLHGRMLIESGTFKDAQTGEAFANSDQDLELSICFSHPEEEPGKQKQYDNIHRIERSLLPAGMASNLLTKFYIQKGESMKTEEKLKALIAILKGKPEVAQQILDDAVALEKAATDAGLSTKEVQEMFAAPADPAEPQTKEVVQTPAADAPAAPVETKELSLDRKAQVARDAIYASLNPMGLEKASTSDNGWPIEIYETYAIINKQGKNYRVPYTIGAEGKASLGDAVEVEQDWKPVEKMLARFEAQEKAAPAAPPAEPVEIGDWTPEQLQKFILDCVKPMMSKKESEDAQVAEKAAKTEAALAEITTSLKALSEASAALAKVSNENQQALRELTDARPAGLKQLQERRPTEHVDNVVATAPTGPQIDPAFRNFSQGGK